MTIGFLLIYIAFFSLPVRLGKKSGTFSHFPCLFFKAAMDALRLHTLGR
jgi:hypothetical protein